MTHDSSTILKLLATKHAEDVFVPECKDGPSHGSMVKLDAWAMVKSWAKPCATGYEIKVSRSDFLRDKKWPAYLPMCNELYFVCPPNVIKPEECPEPCGLMYVASTGNRLFTKKRAPWREVTIPEEVFRYILMCRVRIIASDFNGSSEQSSREARTKYWRQWLEDRKASKKLGYSVSEHIARHVDDVEREIELLRTKHKNYDDIRQVLVECGWGPNSEQWITGQNFKDRIERMKNDIPDGLCGSLRQLQASITQTLNRIESLQKAA